MGMLLRELIIFIAILYIIRVVARALLPMLFNNLVNKAQQQNQQNRYTNYQQTDPRESKVKVDFIPPTATKGKVPDSEGDFIDYEEIK